MVPLASWPWRAALICLFHPQDDLHNLHLSPDHCCSFSKVSSPHLHRPSYLTSLSEPFFDRRRKHSSQDQKKGFIVRHTLALQTARTRCFPGISFLATVTATKYNHFRVKTSVVNPPQLPSFYLRHLLLFWPTDRRESMSGHRRQFSSRSRGAYESIS